MASYRKNIDHPRFISDLSVRYEEICSDYNLGTLSVESVFRNSKGQIVVKCYCFECSKSYEISYYNIKSFKTTNCRCQRALRYRSFAEQVAGMRYDSMKQRCENENDANYKNYGGRGIRNNFESRREYIDYVVNELSFEGNTHLDIDRIDNDGHYEPGNLRLVTRSENLGNRRPRSSPRKTRRRRPPPSRND